MSKELKDLIDSLDSANRAHSDLETIIRYLKEEVKKLNFTIKEQKRIIQSQKAKLSNFEESTIPEDIQVLKDLVVKQREEIIKKDKDIEILTQTIEDITTELETAQEFDEENEELIYSNKVIVQLTEENEIKQRKIKKLEAKIEELQKIIQSSESKDLKQLNQKLIDAKKLIFQLTEESGLNRVQIESLKANVKNLQSSLHESELLKNQYFNELEDANQKFEHQNNELLEFKEKLDYLQKKLEETKKVQELDNADEKLIDLETKNNELKKIIDTNIEIIEKLKNDNFKLNNKLEKASLSIKQTEKDHIQELTEKEERLTDLNTKLDKIQNTNKKLSDLIVELKLKEESTSRNGVPISTPIPIKNEINLVFDPPYIFHRMFNLLDDGNKKQIIDHLIEDLDQKNIRNKRIYALKILSTINEPRIFQAFKNLIDDKDWIIKLYLIKALSKFKNPEVKEVLLKLQKDTDVDVREAAGNLLSKFNKM
jgi:chromosome segregation ATPase